MIVSGDLGRLRDEFEMIGRLNEFAKSIRRQSGNPVGIGDAVAGAFGCGPGHVIGAFAVAMEEPAGGYMGPREIVSGNAEPPFVYLAVDIACCLGQLPAMVIRRTWRTIERADFPVGR
jgi:hypothetical protein